MNSSTVCPKSLNESALVKLRNVYSDRLAISQTNERNRMLLPEPTDPTIRMRARAWPEIASHILWRTAGLLGLLS
jgi:hypothetical protein